MYVLVETLCATDQLNIWRGSLNQTGLATLHIYTAVFATGSPHILFFDDGVVLNTFLLAALAVCCFGGCVVFLPATTVGVNRLYKLLA